jgi:hypothetical protein
LTFAPEYDIPRSEVLMTQIIGFLLYIQPNIGSTHGGSGLIIGYDGGACRMHAFHSREQGRILLDRYRAGMPDDAYHARVTGNLAKAFLPDRSDVPSVEIEGFMAEMTHCVFRANSEAKIDRLDIVRNEPRISICFLSMSEDEGLCAWKSRDEWHVADFFSKAAATSLGTELAEIVAPSDMADYRLRIASSRLPATSERPIRRFRGNAAAVICHAYEEEQLRLAGS